MPLVLWCLSTMIHSPFRSHHTEIISQLFHYLIRWSQFELDSSTHDRILIFLWTMPILQYKESQFRDILNHLKIFLFNSLEIIHLRLLAIQILGIMIFYNASMILGSSSSSLRTDLLEITENLMKESHLEVSHI